MTRPRLDFERALNPSLLVMSAINGRLWDGVFV
jgi:hypothetical protein